MAEEMNAREVAGRGEREGHGPEGVEEMMQLHDLDIQQRDVLLSFMDITQLEDANLCRSILFQNNWNLEQALENFIRGRDEVNHSSNSNSNSNSHNNSTGTQRSSSNHYPLLTNQQQSTAAAATQTTIFDFIISPLRWIFRIYPESLHPDEDATQFLTDFRREYGENGPAFQGVSYSQVVSNANRESKFLLIYLHSPLHEDTGRFCRQVLCSERITRLVNGNDVLVWGGSIWDPEPYNLSLQLKVSTFPFLALLTCESERSVQILDRIQGFIEERVLVERLNTATNQGRVHLNRSRSVQRRREEEALLRAEQDREFREAVELDQRAQEQKQREAELKQQQEEEEAQRQELEAAIQLSQQLKAESQLQQDKKLLEDKGIPPSDDGAALIRFQLPHGIKLSRRFWRMDPISVLYAFLRVHFAEINSPVTRIMISTNFPKKDLEDTEAMTVEDAGLYPRGALFVQDLDA